MNSYEEPSEIFKSLAHPARLQILDLLRSGEVCVCHIEAALNKRQAYVSQQLMALREAGLVDSRRDGLKVYYRIVNLSILELLNLMLGVKHTVGIPCIEGCPCPHCSEISVTQIQ